MQGERITEEHGVLGVAEKQALAFDNTVPEAMRVEIRAWMEELQTELTAISKQFDCILDKTTIFFNTKTQYGQYVGKFFNRYFLEIGIELSEKKELTKINFLTTLAHELMHRWLDEIITIEQQPPATNVIANNETFVSREQIAVLINQKQKSELPFLSSAFHEGLALFIEYVIFLTQVPKVDTLGLLPVVIDSLEKNEYPMWKIEEKRLFLQSKLRSCEKQDILRFVTQNNIYALGGALIFSMLQQLGIEKTLTGLKHVNWDKLKTTKDQNKIVEIWSNPQKLQEA